MTIDDSKNNLYFVLIQCNIVTIVTAAIVFKSKLLPNLDKNSHYYQKANK